MSSTAAAALPDCYFQALSCIINETVWRPVGSFTLDIAKLCLHTHIRGKTCIRSELVVSMRLPVLRWEVEMMACASMFLCLHCFWILLFSWEHNWCLSYHNQSKAGTEKLPKCCAARGFPTDKPWLFISVNYCKGSGQRLKRKSY